MQQHQELDKGLTNVEALNSDMQNNNKHAQQTQQVKSVWNRVTQQKPLTINAQHQICAIALSPDGKYIASAGKGDYSIRIWDPSTGKQAGYSLGVHTSLIHSINYSQCGKYIVSGSSDQTIMQWNASTVNQIGKTIKGHKSNVMGVCYTPNRKYIISGSFDSTIRLWNSKTGIEDHEKQFQHTNQIWCLSHSPISSEVVIGNDAGWITIYNYEKQQSQQFVQSHVDGVDSIQYSSDGKLIVSGSSDTTIRIWDAITRLQITLLNGNTAAVLGVSFSPDNNYIISGDYTARLWDRQTGQHQILSHHKQGIYGTKFSLDGKYIIIGDLDKQLRILVSPYN